MNRIIFLMLLVLSLSASGATIPQAASVLNSGMPSDPTSAPGMTLPISDIAKKIVLTQGKNTTGGSTYFNFYRMGGSGSPSPYQVTVGKTLYCSGYYGEFNTANRLKFGYGTAALISNDTGTAPTGNVRYGDSSDSYGIRHASTGDGVYKFFPIGMSFPASSYPYVYFITSTVDWTINLDCYEN